MISFLQFLREESIYSPLNELSAVDVVAWCEKHASQYLEHAANHLIFRGMSHVTLGTTDTSLMNRISNDTNNYYNVWIDNAPAWKDYPKRSKSLICTSASFAARSYGTLHLIIPADTCKIGICPNYDIWDSFYKLTEFGITSIKKLDFILGQLINSIESGSELASSNYQVFEEFLKKINLEWLEDKTFMYRIADIIRGALEKSNCNNLYEFMAEYLTPEKNDFRVTEGRNYDLSNNDNNEVWIQGGCALIPISYFRRLDIASENHDVMAKFNREYGLGF